MATDAGTLWVKSVLPGDDRQFSPFRDLDCRMVTATVSKRVFLGPVLGAAVSVASPWHSVPGLCASCSCRSYPVSRVSTARVVFFSGVFRCLLLYPQ